MHKSQRRIVAGFFVFQPSHFCGGFVCNWSIGYRDVRKFHLDKLTAIMVPVAILREIP